MNNIQETVKLLGQLLDEERVALLAGNIEHVGRLFEEKELLIESLSQLDDAEIAQLSDLNSKIERNQALLNAAMDGIQSVARRLAAMKRIRNSLDTYDAQGCRNNIDMHHRRAVEKRA